MSKLIISDKKLQIEINLDSSNVYYREIDQFVHILSIIFDLFCYFNKIKIRVVIDTNVNLLTEAN